MLGRERQNFWPVLAHCWPMLALSLQCVFAVCDDSRGMMNPLHWSEEGGLGAILEDDLADSFHQARIQVGNSYNPSLRCSSALYDLPFYVPSQSGYYTCSTMILLAFVARNRKSDVKQYISPNPLNNEIAKVLHPIARLCRCKDVKPSCSFREESTYKKRLLLSIFFCRRFVQGWPHTHV